MNLRKLAEELRQVVDGSERMNEYEIRLASDHCSAIATALELGQKAVEACSTHKQMCEEKNLGKSELIHYKFLAQRDAVLAEAEAE